jgi:RNA-directed DNA polymerase
MSGWFAYHAVPGNHPSLNLLRRGVIWHWRRALRRRGQRDTTSWADIFRLSDRWLPKARIHHPWPNQRYAVTHERWEPDALIGHVRFCAGGRQ